MKFRNPILACAVGLALAQPAMAQTDLDKLKAEVEALKQEVASAAEWKDPRTLVHMAGYADVTYADSESAPGGFSGARFAPIFHYQIDDLVMLEAELEFANTEAGDTEVALEYLTIDWFMNDHATLVAGKFLSPLGQFRQNFHPSWINKMASAPVGFGHDQAAPNADVGFQVRGGFTFDSMNLNYAVFVGNGPTAETAGGEFEMIESPGFPGNSDDTRVGGGRLGLLFPDQKLEVGFSAATGNIDIRTTLAPTYEGVKRDYSVLGADLTWHPGNFDVRAEYIQQSIGEAAASSVPESADWTAWYAQVAYRFLPSKWEVVARYSDYDTPGVEGDRVQLAGGVNYVFESNFVAKLNYESNDNPNDGYDADNRVLAQLAYGF